MDETQTTPAQLIFPGKQVGVFLVVTFGLTWGWNFVMYRTVGYAATTSSLLFLQTMMLIPAFSAILLQVFFFADSSIHFRRFRRRPRWFFYFFMIFTILYANLAILAARQPLNSDILSAVASSLAIFGLLILIAIRGFSNREDFATAGLVGGRLRDWVLYGAAFTGFYFVQFGLNRWFSLGATPDVAQILAAIPGGNQLSPDSFLLIAGIQTIVVGSLLGLLFSFGEEFGWRGYLQGNLVRIGKRKGILLLGLIWSVWHYPIVWMGHQYPGQPLAGTLLITVIITCLAFILGYVMLRTGAIWLVAFLHGLNNQVLAYLISLVYTPRDAVLSFGPGVYGIPFLLLIVLLLLLDPIWKSD